MSLQIYEPSILGGYYAIGACYQEPTIPGAYQEPATSENPKLNTACGTSTLYTRLSDRSW